MVAITGISLLEFVDKTKNIISLVNTMVVISYSQANAVEQTRSSHTFFYKLKYH